VDEDDRAEVAEIVQVVTAVQEDLRRDPEPPEVTIV
jgi:hypothetical protein